MEKDDKTTKKSRKTSSKMITISPDAYQVLRTKAYHEGRTMIAQLDLIILGRVTTKGSGRPSKVEE